MVGVGLGVLGFGVGLGRALGVLECGVPAADVVVPPAGCELLWWRPGDGLADPDGLAELDGLAEPARLVVSGVVACDCATAAVPAM